MGAFAWVSRADLVLFRSEKSLLRLNTRQKNTDVKERKKQLGELGASQVLSYPSTLSMADESGGGIRKQTPGMSLVSPVLDFTSQSSSFGLESSVTFSPLFTESCKRQSREMVITHENFPDFSRFSSVHYL